MVTISLAPAAKGTINVPLHIQAAIEGAKTIRWLCDKQVIYTVELDGKTLNFTPKEDGIYNFTVTADDGQTSQSAVIQVTVGSGTTPAPTPAPTPSPTPEPTPTPSPSGDLLWSSNVHGKWNDGNKRTITTSEGTQKPDDKSIFCAASGNPKLQINGDGTAILISGSGTTENISLRQRSRHNGNLDNKSLPEAQRFGGHGWSVHKDGSVEFKTEDFHNVHSNAHSFKSGINIGENWHHVTLTLKGLKSSCTVDGKGIGTVDVKNHGDDSLLPKLSYIWIRNNNNDNGRIYIVATNIDSRLEVDFKLSGASIYLKNVELYKL